MLPDDDKRYAIETCRSSESILKKWFKINDIQLVHLLVMWYLVNQNTHFRFKNLFLTNMRFIRIVEKQCRAGEATDDKWHMLIACWIRKSKDTYTEHVIYIVFPWQKKWLWESASKLLLHVLCLSCYGCNLDQRVLYITHQFDSDTN